MGRKSNGRKKIDMVKIQNERNLQVSFSKRRIGLFKKASELCTLSGAEVALVGFSPGNKVYSFGHPSVDLIMDRFLAENPQPNANVGEVNMEELIDKEGILEMERSRGKDLQRTWREERWSEAPIEELNFFQLQQMAEAMEMTKGAWYCISISYPWKCLGSLWGG
uniref:Agamous-like MADS-box protein AGL62 n=1 Tax=Nicotiana tabacum TaxID=4097 RepID=A0A1S4BIB0_TOBAC|nr:PREDICTED: agamous-like MADS-box protein AGL62 [Nicotiana tabacum]